MLAHYFKRNRFETDRRKVESFEFANRKIQVNCTTWRLFWQDRMATFYGYCMLNYKQCKSHMRENSIC